MSLLGLALADVSPMLLEARSLALGLLALVVVFIVGNRLIGPSSRTPTGSDALGASDLVPVTDLKAGMLATLESAGSSGIVTRPATLSMIEKGALVFVLEEAPLLICQGSPIRVTVAVDRSAARFQTTVLDFENRLHGQTLYVAVPEWSEKIQRRDHFRVPVQMPTVVGPIERDGAGDTFSGHIEDLSGGGVRIGVPHRQPAGRLVRLRLPIEEMGEPYVDARVKFTSCGTGETSYPFCIHCEFLYIQDSTRKFIVDHCNRVQLRSAKSDASLTHRP